MSQRFSYKVTGRVQGVCFRMETVKAANACGVTGYVKNASDGSVVGEAQGDSSSLQKFEQFLNKGPSAARVSGVEKTDLEVKEGESQFHQMR
ncbi:acylphosphatase [Pseudovirgaria hyperparasitica]|uniref:Acylphosphatase n=1 Tax=Pseudovirgaria hyperparasitica TaxID=470096 RepID=A0A6A6WD75_9PEZI|nr:acylphosphatase [Pseudovirgaria hyperparasitica]KAF2760014.1 acylphosphatase [Pseudovirgaria hyperparasitica]